MSTKTNTASLSNVGYFWYTSDLKIEPQISKVKHSGTFYELKTTKDENVEIVDGEIKVVTTEVTALKANHKETETVYSADEMRGEIEKIAGLAKANKAELNGQVVIRTESDGSIFRVLVTNNKVEVQQGEPAARWPDGTSSLLPKGGDD
jgi:hypothetical protein